MSATYAKFKQELKAEGRREVVVALILLWLNSLILHDMVQRNWFNALPSSPGTYVDNASLALFISTALTNAFSCVVQFFSCLIGVSKIHEGSDELVYFSAAIGSLFSLAVVVLVEGGEVGCRGLLGRVAWPFVAMTTLASVFVMVKPTGMDHCVENYWINEGESSSEDYTTENDCSDDAGTTNDDVNTNEDDSTAEDSTTNDDDRTDEKEALKIIPAAEAQVVALTLRMDLEEVGVIAKQLMASIKHLQVAFALLETVAMQNEETATSSESDGWQDVKELGGKKSD